LLQSCRVSGGAPILDADSRRDAASTSDSEQPRRDSLWGTRGLLTTPRRGEPASL